MISTYRHMVALGSSFASGPGIPPLVDRRAGRSKLNYAHLVAAELGASLVDATVGGATTATIVDTPQRLPGRSFPPQLLSVPADADLVTVTAGGNDIGYLRSVIMTAIGDSLIAKPVTRPIGRRLKSAQPIAEVSDDGVEAVASGLTRVVEAVRERAPGADVLLVDYLPILDAEDAHPLKYPALPADRAAIRAIAAGLSTGFRRAAERTGASLVPASAFASGHGVDSAEPWVTGLTLLPGRGAAFHPTAAGMTAVADVVLSALDRP